MATYTYKQVDQLLVEDLSPELLRSFLFELEEKRQCSPVTRNHRLAAIRSLAHFIATHSPEYVEWCARIRTIPFKKTARPTVTYLEKDEMDALLARQIARHRWGVEIMHCCYFFITQVHEPMKWHMF